MRRVVSRTLVHDEMCHISPATTPTASIIRPLHATQYDASMKRMRVLTTSDERTQDDDDRFNSLERLPA